MNAMALFSLILQLFFTFPKTNRVCEPLCEIIVLLEKCGKNAEKNVLVVESVVAVIG